MNATPAEVFGIVRRVGAALLADGATARGVADSTGGQVRDDGPPLGVHALVGNAVEVVVTRIWGSDAPAAAEVRPRSPLSLADIEAEFGAARPVPRTHPGPDRLIFDAPPVPQGCVLLVATQGPQVLSLTVRIA